MADAALGFLLGNLKDLAIYLANLSSDIKNDMDIMLTDLNFLNYYLKEPLKNRRNNNLMKALDRKIREAVYEVEDVLETFARQAQASKKSICGKLPLDLPTVEKKVLHVKQMVESAKSDLLNLKADADDKHGVPELEVRHPRLKNVVGFEKVTKELIDCLIKDTGNFEVVCLTGMLGSGKTTLAWKIFQDPEIINKFGRDRIWLTISKEFSDKDIFTRILKHFTNITEDVHKKDEKDLTLLVTTYLEAKSFLIVMDDVWTLDDWKKLKDALPNNNIMGKVLITSRTDNVGTSASDSRFHHRLQLFDEEEGLELLGLEALGKPEYPSTELENLGRLIVGACKRLPLAVGVIGAVLAAKSSFDVRNTEREWEKVSKQVEKYLMEEPNQRMNKFIYLSYHELPYHLRVCFLYLQMFPKASQIPASKLILMWIAEGFIQRSNDSSLEETGEEYLAELINRNLVIVEKNKHDGKIKTCRVHDSLYEFCENEAAAENFLQEIKSKNGVLLRLPDNIDKYRRLSIHSNCSEFISFKPVGPRVRSFVCFPEGKFILPSENIPTIFKAFNLVRVLDVNCIKFPKIHNDLFQLVHLRYIALSFDSPILPSKFSHFWNLQTLIVHTTSETLKVEADIWKLIQLRLFKTNVSTTLPQPSKHNKHGVELQTLGTVSVESCTTELFQRACNLKKLGIRGQLSLFFDERKGYFSSLRKMKFLESLKLINDVYHVQPSAGELNGLPPHNQFPPRLKSLTLRATYLDWTDMSILGQLPNLELLKLKDKAFTGKRWIAVDGGFRRLEVLIIEDTDLEVWACSSKSAYYPKLRRLVLRNCEKLLSVPGKLADIKTFEMLELYTCKSAEDSARKIKEAKIKSQASFTLLSYS